MNTPFHLSTDSAAACAHAVRHGLMSEGQYRFLADRLQSAAPCTLLVFGLGHDAAFWASCVNGKIAFVEDDPTYLTAVPPTIQVILNSFNTRVGMWCDVPEPPRQIQQAWDFVLVDGPVGFNRNCPGRQWPIAWARRLANRQIFVHDYERAWERLLCDRLLGTPVEVIPSAQSRPGTLAVFDCRNHPTADPQSA